MNDPRHCCVCIVYLQWRIQEGGSPWSQSGKILKILVTHKIYCYNWSKIYILPKLNSKISKYQNVVLLNGSKNVRSVIQMALKWLFLKKKLQKLTSGWGLRLQTPYVLHLSCSSCSVALHKKNTFLNKKDFNF